MKAVVTGAAGFIGSHLVDRLLEEDWEVVGVDDLSAGTPRPNVRPNFIPYIGKAQFFPWVGECDVIFHLAGKVGPLGVLKFAGSIALDTISSADRMGWEAERYGIPLIDISTSEVYGSPDHKNAEDDPKVFFDASARQEYAIAKLAAETMLLNRRNLDVRVVRPFNVAGPRQRTEGGFVIPRFTRQALNDEVVTVYAPGSQRRAFTHVSDIVDGIMLVYKNGTPKEIYNLGNPANETTILELAEDIVGYIGGGRIEIVDPVALHGPSFKEAPDKVPNAKKAMSELGWYPTKTTEDIVRDYVESVR